MEANEKVVEKIRKLLAIADKKSNNNEHEVMAATLKAQKMMAEYNISLSEVSKDTHKKDIELMVAESKGYRDFRKPLGALLAENFRCKVLLLDGRDVLFVGNKTDVLIVKETFEYLYEFVVKEGNKRYNRAVKRGEASADVFNSYAIGFMIGLKQALDKQCRALMLIIPEEVEDAYNKLNKQDGTPFNNPDNLDADAWREGKHDGTTALTGKRLN